MAQTIKLKSSVVQNKIPLLGDLELGELAINARDGKIFFKKTDMAGTDEIVEIGSGTGLKLITEYFKTGWRFIGKDPANYGDIGQEAVDLSHSDIPGITHGATGDNSFAAGLNVIASNQHQTSIGKYNSVKSNSIFEVGIGTAENSRFNALEAYTSGEVKAPNLQISHIISDDKSLVTKEYIDSVIGGDYVEKETTGTSGIVNKLWTGTEAEYNALGLYDDDIIYFVKA